jgi:hypothetical protein
MSKKPDLSGWNGDQVGHGAEVLGGKVVLPGVVRCLKFAEGDLKGTKAQLRADCF